MSTPFRSVCNQSWFRAAPSAKEARRDIITVQIAGCEPALSPDYPSRAPDASGAAASGSFDVVLFFHSSSSSSLAAFSRNSGAAHLLHIKVVLDVAVAQHEVLPDLDGDQVLGRQVGHHVDVFDAFVGVLHVQVERLLVEDRRRGVLVLVGPASHLDHALHERDGEFGVLLGHHLGAGDGGGNVGHLQASSPDAGTGPRSP